MLVAFDAFKRRGKVYLIFAGSAHQQWISRAVYGYRRHIERGGDVAQASVEPNRRARATNN